MGETIMDKEHAAIMNKLDALMANQNAMLTAQALINSRLESQEKTVSELSLTVRGGPGVPGLVTDVAIIRASLDDICNSDACKDAAVEKMSGDDDPHITWRWVMDKVLVPVITGVVMWFLITVLPGLLTHLGAGVNP